MRPGKIGKNEIEEVLGIEIRSESTRTKQIPKSPGQKYSHYKPNADVFYGEIDSIKGDVLYLVQSDFGRSRTNVITYNGDLHLLSKELFDRFRQADLDHYSAVFIQNIDKYKTTHPSIYAALINRINKAKV